MILSARNLLLGYQHPVLEVDHLEIPRGALMTILGPNGAGKSTLLRCLAGLAQPLGGSISSSLHRPGEIAYLPQRQEVQWSFPLTVQDVVMMGRDVHLRWPRRPTPGDRSKVEQALRQVGLQDYGNRSIDLLSGGEQQRVFLARALAQEAILLLLDEPFAGVDAANQERIWELLEQIHREGKTLILVNHDFRHCHDCTLLALLVGNRVLCDHPSRILTSANLSAAYGSGFLCSRSLYESAV